MIDLSLGEFGSDFGAGVGLRFLTGALQLVGLRIHPRDFFSTSPLVDSHFAWDSSSPRRLLQTSINALPITRPGQVPVPNDQCTVLPQLKLENVIEFVILQSSGGPNDDTISTHIHGARKSRSR